jgi:hypothetical protein
VCVCVLLLQDLLQSCSRGGGGEWRTCAVRDDEPRPVWMRLPITHYGWVSEVVGKQRRANLEKEETESEDEYCSKGKRQRKS